MDPVSNPYAPGAGSPPPELAGRDELSSAVSVALKRLRIGRPAKSVLLVGLRGVGKTVLLGRMRSDADARGMITLWVEAPEGRSLPAMLAPQLRVALLTLSRNERAKELAARALRGLAGFARALKVRYQDIEVALDFEPEPGLADNGDLEQDLQALLEVAGLAAREAATALVVFVDELQYVEEDELASLITALHRTVQRSLPVVLVGAGLPQLRARMGRAKSYAERLFDFPDVGPLPPEAARYAIEKPARDEGVAIESDALDRIVAETHGYPYFLQEWGKHAWDAADESPIDLDDVENRLADGSGHPGRELLPRTFRSAYATGKTIPESHGRTRRGTASLRRDRGAVGPRSHIACSNAKPTDRKGHGVEPRTWRHRIHRAAF